MNFHKKNYLLKLIPFTNFKEHALKIQIKTLQVNFHLTFIAILFFTETRFSDDACLILKYMPLRFRSEALLNPWGCDISPATLSWEWLEATPVL